MNMLHHIIVHLITAVTNGWSDRCNNVLRMASVNGLHFTHHSGCNLGHSSLPARMGKTDDLVHRIIKIKGYTIRIKRSQQNSRYIRKQTISCLKCRGSILLTPPTIGFPYHCYFCSMGLFSTGPSFRLEIKSFRKRPTIR
ncbi:hypothetical protein D3C78_1406640 [compost metagenome]